MGWRGQSGDRAAGLPVTPLLPTQIMRSGDCSLAPPVRSHSMAHQCLDCERPLL